MSRSGKPTTPFANEVKMVGRCRDAGGLNTFAPGPTAWNSTNALSNFSAECSFGTEHREMMKLVSSAQTN